MNPYNFRLNLFVENADKAALGQFMRDFGADLENFHVGDGDVASVPVSGDGVGPPDGWCFSSAVTEAQANAFVVAPFPVPVQIGVWPHGSQPDFDDWLASLVPPMVRIVEE